MFITLTGVNFTSKSILKKEFDNGNIPLKRDITGAALMKGYVTVDHTIPKSQGGKSDLSNYSLMDYAANNKRSSKPIKNVIDLASLIEYIRVFLDVKTPDLDGIDYLRQWLPTLQKAVKNG